MLQTRFYTKILFVFALSIPQALIAAENTEESTTIAKEPSISKNETTQFINELKEKYNLTDEQMTTLKNSGLPTPDLARLAYLSKNSSKSINEILAMRVDQKMGWGKIAKELNVHPGELGRAVAAAHHDVKEDRLERHEAKMEKREQKMENREQRAQNRAERNNNHKEK